MKTYNKYYPYILLIVLYFAYLWPNLLSLDKIGNQWLHLGVVNIVGLFSVAYYKKLNAFKEIFKDSLIPKIWVLFLLVAFVSIFFAENLPEAVITFNQYFTFIFSFYIIQILVREIKNPIAFMINLVVFSLFLDLIFSFNPILEDLKANGQIRPRSMDYKGLSANINIISFMMVLKMPFLIEKFFQVKKSIFKYLLIIVVGLTVYCVLAMGTRGAYLGLGLILIFIVSRSLMFSKQNLILKLKPLLLLLLVFIISIIANISTTPKAQINSIERASTISLNTQDGSVNQRLRYYKQGLSHIINNPILGVGIGNWKLISIDYDKNNIDGFIVPFHAHNDFIQIGAELGIIGLLSYLSIFIVLVIGLFKKVLEKNKVALLLLFSVSVYVIDSMLNFPIARPISIMSFLYLITVFQLLDAERHEK